MSFETSKPLARRALDRAPRSRLPSRELVNAFDPLHNLGLSASILPTANPFESELRYDGIAEELHHVNYSEMVGVATIGPMSTSPIPDHAVYSVEALTPRARFSDRIAG